MNLGISVAVALVLAVPGPNAGGEAGVGRAHPGRGVGPVVEVPLAPAEPVTVPAVVPDDAPEARHGGLVLEVLPLGVGFTLMGAGLGFIGLRLRRGLLR